MSLIGTIIGSPLSSSGITRGHKYYRAIRLPTDYLISSLCIGCLPYSPKCQGDGSSDTFFYRKTRGSFVCHILRIYIYPIESPPAFKRISIFRFSFTLIIIRQKVYKILLFSKIKPKFSTQEKVISNLKTLILMQLFLHFFY